MTFKFTDSHAHLTSDAVFPLIEEVLSLARQAGVCRIINICTDLETLYRALSLSSVYPWVHHAASITPQGASKATEEAFDAIAFHARKGDLIAIGETGLDYYYESESKEIQKKLLSRYLALALECNLPVIIHCREAFKDFFDILDAEYVVSGKHAPGVLHCFTGTALEAEEVLKRGWHLSFSGIVTFKKSLELKQVASMTPLSQMLIETDTPYLAPQSKRGKQNQPSYLVETAAAIAEIKGVSLEDVAKATSENAAALFKLPQLDLCSKEASS